MKYASKEGVKAYGYGGNLTVESVVIVSKLKNATAEKRQMSEQKKKGTVFQQVLEKACEQQAKQQRKPQHITCYTNGYTKFAQPFIYQVEQKEYC